MKFKDHLNYISKDTKNLKQYFANEHFIAIDIGSHSTKLMEVKKVGPEYAIKKTYHMPELTEYFKDRDIDNLTSLVDNIAHIMEVEGMKAKDIYLIYSSSRLQSKVVQVPEIGPKELASYIEIEFQKKFPSHNRINNVVDYMSLGTFETSDEEKHQMVLMTTVPISEASSMVREFEKKKMNVRIIDADIRTTTNVAVLAIHEHIDRAVLDVGRQNSRIIFMRGDVPVFHREFTFGINNITKSLQDKLNISVRDSEKLLNEIGMQAYEDIFHKGNYILKDIYNSTIEANFMDVFNEVFRSFQYVFSSYGVEAKEMLLTGGMASLKHSDKCIKKIFDINTISAGVDSEGYVKLPNGCFITNETGENIEGVYANCLGLIARGGYK